MTNGFIQREREKYNLLKMKKGKSMRVPRASE